MDYMSIKQAAEKWGMSVRSVQHYCVNGFIEGATKFSGSWAIPENTAKPENTSKKSAKTEEPVSSTIAGIAMRMPMPLLNTAFTPGSAKEAVEAIEDEKSREIALCEYYYFRGQQDKASEIAEKYLHSEDIGLRLSACWIYAYANLALDKTENTRKAMANVKEILGRTGEDTPKEVKTLAVFVSIAASVLLHLPIEGEMPTLKDFIVKLPSGLRLFALYVQAHYSYINKDYGASVGIVETALALEHEVYPIPTLYLHMMAVMDYMSLKQPEKAKEHMLAAWELARPDDLIEPLAEHHGLLGGMLEATLKKDWQKDFKRIIAITYKFSAGWRKIHNPATGRSVADNLTTTEFAASMLAARGWSNKEIAAHMGISENTVKTYIATSLQKLHISQRKDLKNFMLH